VSNVPRLLCVYQHAPTRGAAGFYRHRLYFAELVRRGWHVDLVSTPVHYMTGQVPPAYRHRLHLHEQIDGVDHHWVWASGQIHASRVRRVANYLSFAATAAARGLTLPTPSIVWASSPPLTVGTVGAALARRFRRPWLFEIRDLWPESAASVGWLSSTSPIYAVLERAARRYASGADAVIVPTEGLVEGARRHGARTIEIMQGVVLDQSRDEAARTLFRAELGIADDVCLFVYMGAHGVANGLDLVLDAAKLLRDTDPSITFVLAGDGSDRRRIQGRVAQERLRNVHLIGIVERDQIWDLLAASDVCLHCLRPDPLFEGALPTKMLEYFGAHRAVVTTVPGQPRELALTAGGGFASTADELATEARRWASMSAEERRSRGERGYALGMSRFGLTPTVDRLEGLLRRTIEEREDGRRGRRRAPPELLGKRADHGLDRE
jgi:glycosyltransferase involved in cell wall biosynthesis